MKILHAATVFFTIGLALAREFFNQIGLHADYSVIGVLGLAMTTLLIFRGILPMIGIAILAMLVSQSDATWATLHMDRQLLEAAALTVVLFPWIRRFLIDA